MAKNLNRLTDSLRAWLNIACAGVIALVLFTNLPLFVSDLGSSSTVAALTYLALFPLGLLLLLLQSGAVLPYLRTPLFLWSLALLVLFGSNLARLQLGGGTPEQIAIQTETLQRVLLLPLIGFLAFAGDARWYRLFVPVAAVIVPAFIIVDFLLPDLMRSVMDAENDSLRATGTLFDPNAAAEACVYCCILAHGVTRRVMLGLVVSLCGIAILLTFSRSGMLMYAILLVVLFARGALPKAFLVLPVVAVIGFGSLSVAIEQRIRANTESEGTVDKLVQRLNFFNRDASDVAVDLDEDGRSDLAREAFDAVLEAPLMGHGTEFRSANDDSKPHNLVLHLWHIYGLAGVALWAAFAWLLWRGEPGANPLLRLGAISFLVYSMFSHNIFEYVHWYAFVAMYLFVTAAGARSWQGARGIAAHDGRGAEQRRRRQRRRRAGSSGPFHAA